MKENQKTKIENFYENKFYKKTTRSGYRNPKYDQFMGKVNRVLAGMFALFILFFVFLLIGNAIGIPFIEDWVLRYL